MFGLYSNGSFSVLHSFFVSSNFTLIMFFARKCSIAIEIRVKYMNEFDRLVNALVSKENNPLKLKVSNILQFSNYPFKLKNLLNQNHEI